MIDITADAFGAVMTHCKASPHEEACGILAGKAGPRTPAELDIWIPMRNVSEYRHARFEFDPEAQLGVWQQLAHERKRVGIIYHSHLAGDATPSPTDRRFGAVDPHILHLIVAAPNGRLECRLWEYNRNGEATELEFTVEGQSWS